MPFNPYEPPTNPQQRKFKLKPDLPPEPTARDRLFGPALALMIVSAIFICILVVFMFLDVFILASDRAHLFGSPTISGPTKIVIRLIFSVVLLAINTFIVFGANCMRVVKNYDIAFAAAVMAVIPCCGPCYILGIPFGAWAIVVLKDPRVKASFRENRR